VRSMMQPGLAVAPLTRLQSGKRAAAPRTVAFGTRAVSSRRRLLRQRDGAVREWRRHAFGLGTVLGPPHTRPPARRAAIAAAAPAGRRSRECRCGPGSSSGRYSTAGGARGQGYANADGELPHEDALDALQLITGAVRGRVYGRGDQHRIGNSVSEARAASGRSTSRSISGDFVASKDLA
jgi:hypothetical protein